MGSRHYSDLKHSITLAGIEKTQGRRQWTAGGFTDFVCIRFEPNRLSLRDIDQSEQTPKVHAIGHLRFVKAFSFGRERPRVVLWSRLHPDRPASELFPGISATTDESELFYSSNSLITYALRQLLAHGWLRFKAGEWSADIPLDESIWQARATAILDFLTAEKRLHLYAMPGQPPPAFDDLAGVHPTEDLIPLDRLGYVRELVWRENPLAAFNTAYFLLEHNDFLSHHSALGQAYNLFISDSVIQRPPLYRRSTLYQRDDGSWRIAMFGMEDVELLLASSAPPFVVDRPAPVTLYTRRWAISEQNRVIGFTPPAANRHEFTIIDRQVLGYKRGGGLEIPQNGFVLSFDQDALTPPVLAALQTGRVEYRWREEEHRGIRQGIQVGPRLLQDGDMALTAHSLADEAFWIDKRGPDDSLELGVVPSDYPDDVDVTRAGRVGVGIDAGGSLMVGVMMGSETKGVKHPDLDSAGATLVELAEFLQEMGAVDAVNMDGGGSSQLFFLGGLTTVPGNRLGLQSVHYERMVPAVGVVL